MFPERKSEVARITSETQIKLALILDGTGKYQVTTGVGFLDHMLNLFSKHGAFDLTVEASGDTYIDDHHTVEDVGIALGQALKNALGNKAGITRYGHAMVPMDEALLLAVVDISGRGHLEMDLPLPAGKVGTFDTELVEEFFRALALNSGITLHIRMFSGRNTHHIIEGTFKAVGRALRQAVAKDDRLTGIPSTKGVL